MAKKKVKKKVAPKKKPARAKPKSKPASKKLSAKVKEAANKISSEKPIDPMPAEYEDSGLETHSFDEDFGDDCNEGGLDFAPQTFREPLFFL